MRVSYSPASSFNSLVDFIDGRPLQKLTPPSEAETFFFPMLHTIRAQCLLFQTDACRKIRILKARGLSVQQMITRVSDLFSTNFSGSLLLRILVIRPGRARDEHLVEIAMQCLTNKVVTTLKLMKAEASQELFDL